MIGICEVCKKAFNKPPSKVKRDKTCSIKCGSVLISKSKIKKSLDIFCLNCKQLKHVVSSRKSKSAFFVKGFCSKNCEKEFSLVKKVCQQCNCLFKVGRWRADKSKFCSTICYNKSKIGKVFFSASGESSPTWNPNKINRTYPSKKTKELVRKRDGNKCLVCGGKENLHLHHVILYNKKPENKPENMITVCHNCHWDLHRLDFDVYNVVCAKLLAQIKQNERQYKFHTICST